MDITNIAIVVTLALLFILIIWGLILTFVNRTTTKSFWKEEVEVELFEISKLLTNNHPISLKQAVIEMDKLLDYALKQSRVVGNTLGERLKAGKAKFDKKTYGNIWEAHKLRNKLVHEINLSVSTAELKSAYHSLRAGIKTIIR